MSLDYINHNKTVSKVVNGVTVWSNPALSVSIDSFGNVLDKKGKLVKQHESKTYPFRIIKSDNKEVSWTAKYASLFSRMVLGIKLSNRTLRLKDKSKGWVEGNVEAISVHGKGRTGGVGVKEININTLEKLEVVYYTHIQGKVEYITEDGGVFPTKELAEWHQEKVSKGKGNAQVVLDYNGGWVLAEQIYLQEVIYRCEKPYEHFKSVLENNKGVVDNTQEEQCVFSNIKVVDLELHDLKHLEGLECSKDEAEEINKNLVEFISNYAKYVDSLEVLRGSVKYFKSK